MKRTVLESVHKAWEHRRALKRHNPLETVVVVVWRIFLMFFIVAGTLLGLVILGVSLLWWLDLKKEKDIS
jgi:ABC-type Fe3+ transport system permease subunit